MMGLGASDFEFGVDPSADPELALVSNIGRWVEKLIMWYIMCQYSCMEKEKIKNPFRYSTQSLPMLTELLLLVSNTGEFISHYHCKDKDHNTHQQENLIHI